MVTLWWSMWLSLFPLALPPLPSDAVVGAWLVWEELRSLTAAALQRELKASWVVMSAISRLTKESLSAFCGAPYFLFAAEGPWPRLSLVDTPTSVLKGEQSIIAHQDPLYLLSGRILTFNRWHGGHGNLFRIELTYILWGSSPFSCLHLSLFVACTTAL